MGALKKKNRAMFSNTNNEEIAAVAGQKTSDFTRIWSFSLFGKLGCCISEELGKKRTVKIREGWQAFQGWELQIEENNICQVLYNLNT